MWRKAKGTVVQGHFCLLKFSLVARHHVNETQLLGNVHTSVRTRKSGVVDMTVCHSDPLQGKTCYQLWEERSTAISCGHCLAPRSCSPLFLSHVLPTSYRTVRILCLSKRVYKGAPLQPDRRQPWWVIRAPELPASRAGGTTTWLFPLANSVSSPFPSQWLLINILYLNYLSLRLPETKSAIESCSAGRAERANGQGRQKQESKGELR